MSSAEWRRRELQGDPRLLELERFAKARVWELFNADSFEQTARLFAQSREDLEAIRQDPNPAFTPQQRQVESDKIKRDMVTEAKKVVQGADEFRRSLTNPETSAAAAGGAQ